jgi:hypothetical protein
VGRLDLRLPTPDSHNEGLHQGRGLSFERRPRLDAATDYLPVDAPMGGFPPEATVSLTLDGDGQPRLVLSARTDGGEADLVYPFAHVEAAATPAP